MTKKIPLLILFVITIIFSATITETSDYEAIRSAITQRDDLFTRVLGNYQRDGYPDASTIRSRLHSAQDQSSPWYTLLLAESSNNDSEKKQYYQQSISVAGSDIGELWGLFIEFHKRNERTFQNQILEKIERIQLESGITVLPAIAEQLKLLAESEFSHHRYETANYCLDQVSRFATVSFQPSLTQLFIPQSKVDRFAVLAKFTESVKFDWKTQVGIVHHIIKMISGLILVLASFLFFMLMIRHYPKAIHPLTCLYPLNVPYRMRIFFTTLLLLVSTVLGLYPVLVVLTILLLRVAMDNFNALLTRITAVLLLLAPLSGIIESRFGHILSEESSYILYEKALNNQPTPALYNEIKTLSENPKISTKEKALHLTSMALIQYKRKNTQNAVALIRQAYELWPTSEQVLMAASGIYYGFGDSDKALTLFKNALDAYPNSAEVNYNYGQINLEKVGITDGSNYIAKGAALSPNVINGFIKRNSHFFGANEWPLQRNFFYGTISPDSFWDNFMLFSNPPAGTIQKFWGASFFGLPVQISLFIVILLYIINSLIVPTLMHIKKNGECVLCGKPVCKKCRASDFCNECQAVIQNISNESLVSALKIKIADTKRIGILVKAHISDIIFPGTRDFFLKTKSKKRGFILLPFTFISYTIVLFVLTLRPTFFVSTSQTIVLTLLAPSILYSLFFVIQNIRSLIPTILKGNR